MGISAPRLFERYPLASALICGATLAVTWRVVHEYVLKRRLPGSFWVTISAVALAAWYLIRSAGFSLSSGDIAKVLLAYAVCIFLLHWIKPFEQTEQRKSIPQVGWEKDLNSFVDIMKRWSTRNDEELKSSYVSCWHMARGWKQQFPSGSLKTEFYLNHIAQHIVNADRAAIQDSVLAMFETVEFFHQASYVEKLAQLRANFEMNPQNLAWRRILVTLEMLSILLQDDAMFKKYEEIFYGINNWGNWRTIQEYFTCTMTKRPAEAIESRPRAQQLDDEKWSQMLKRDIPLMSTDVPTGLPQEYIKIRQKLLGSCRMEELFDSPKSKTDLRINFRKMASKIAQDKIAQLYPSLGREAQVVYSCVLEAKTILENCSYLPN